MGVSVPNLNPWCQQLLKEGAATQGINQSPVSSLLKLYDGHISKYKLNEQVSFIGILEFKNEIADKTQGQASQIPTGEPDP